MTREDYVQQVKAVLSQHTVEATNRLSAALALVPPKTQAAKITIFVDQDGEGFLGVRVVLVGPDSSFLNRSIAAHAELFTTRMTQSGLQPPLPLMEARREEFSVHDALTDCAASWIVSVWNRTVRSGFHLPISVVSHDGYGTDTPFNLQP